MRTVPLVAGRARSPAISSAPTAEHEKRGGVESLLDLQERSAASWAAGLCDCWACMRSRKEMRTHMILCPECGNKRCPKASDHKLACTGSNESGQPGSVYS